MQLSDQVFKAINDYLAGNATAEEMRLINEWYHSFDDQNVTVVTNQPNYAQSVEARLKQRIAESTGLHVNQPKVRKFYAWKKIAAAAAVLLVAGLSIFFYSRYGNTLRHSGAGQDLGLAGNDIKPGGNKAYLVLSNGKRLSLTDAANGALAKEAGVEITKTADGRVIYSSQPLAPSGRDAAGREGALNTIETPKGGQFQVRLPDGSKVWLNAASKLIYPVSFSGRGHRVVELSGEAYFEIFKNKLQPFVVKSKNQEVTVLGTHFNINSYTDEGSVKTTLLEGSVSVRHREGSTAILNQVQHRLGDLSYRRDDAKDRNNEKNRDGVVLKPGQQAIQQSNKFKVTAVDVDNAIDWKNGKFICENTDLQELLRRVSRWYDVEFVYPPNLIVNEKFTGTLSRTENVSVLLKRIELTGEVKFKIEGRRVRVRK